MSYMHIDNLYKNAEILMLKRCYAMEKIHGTSAHVTYKNVDGAEKLSFFSGGVSHDHFVALFDADALMATFRAMGCDTVTVYGEAYGGKCQGMKESYGADLRFVCFEVKIGDYWLNVPKAEAVVLSLGLEFVAYEEVDTDLASLDEERDRPSVQADRNGMGVHPREGVVLRPLTELSKNNGQRIMAKHKGEAFAERKHPPKVVDAETLKVMEDAKAIAEEFVTPMRLSHVLDAHSIAEDIKETGKVINAMIEDVVREGAGEFEDTKDVRKAVGREAARLFKERLKP